MRVRLTGREIEAAVASFLQKRLSIVERPGTQVTSREIFYQNSAFGKMSEDLMGAAYSIEFEVVEDRSAPGREEKAS